MIHLPDFIEGYGPLPGFRPIILPVLLAILSLWMLWRFLDPARTIYFRVACLSVLMLAAYRFSDLGVRSHLFTSGVPEVKRAVESATEGEGNSPRKMAVVNALSDTAEIRVMSGGFLEAEDLPKDAKAEQLMLYPAVLFAGEPPTDLGPRVSGSAGAAAGGNMASPGSAGAGRWISVAGNIAQAARRVLSPLHPKRRISHAEPHDDEPIGAARGKSRAGSVAARRFIK